MYKTATNTDFSKQLEGVTDFIKEVFNSKESRVILHEPRFLGKEKAYLLDCIDSTFVSSVGKYVNQFEANIAKYTGAKYAVATVNGTAALHMSLLLAGVKPGDLVITQPLTFIATCNALKYIGATPLFVDIDKDTLGLSAEKLADFLHHSTFTHTDGLCYEKKTKRRVSACVPMHSFGHPTKIEELVKVCNSFNIPLIEDAAESLGSTYKNQQTGTFGLMGIYSFNGNKTITCGGGGMIVTNDEKLAKKAKHLTTQAKVPHAWEYKHDHIGYNYRLPNLNAALACAQLEQLDGYIDNKRALAKIYAAYFKNTTFQFFEEPENARSNYWLNAILVKTKEERDQFLKYTNENGVMTRPAWTLMNKLPLFQDSLCGNLDNANDIETRLVNIPSSVRITS